MTVCKGNYHKINLCFLQLFSPFSSGKASISQGTLGDTSEGNEGRRISSKIDTASSSGQWALSFLFPDMPRI